MTHPRHPTMRLAFVLHVSLVLNHKPERNGGINSSVAQWALLSGAALVRKVIQNWAIGALIAPAVLRQVIERVHHAL